MREEMRQLGLGVNCCEGGRHSLFKKKKVMYIIVSIPTQFLLGDGWGVDYIHMECLYTLGWNWWKYLRQRSIDIEGKIVWSLGWKWGEKIEQKMGSKWKGVAVYHRKSKEENETSYFLQNTPFRRTFLSFFTHPHIHTLSTSYDTPPPWKPPPKNSSHREQIMVFSVAWYELWEDENSLHNFLQIMQRTYPYVPSGSSEVNFNENPH